MYLIFLTAQEIKILENHIRKSYLETVRLRAHAILMREQRLSIDSIAKLVFRSPRTITRWLKEYSQIRLASLFSGQIKNENAAKLTRQQKEEVKTILNQPPSDNSLPKEFWDVPKLKEYLSAVFDVVYESKQSYHFLLKFSNLSFKYPDKLSPRRNEEEIKKRMVEIKTQITPLLANPNWIVLASDETRIQLEAEIRRAWLEKGKRTVVKTERSNEKQNYLGFLDQRYGTCQVFEIIKGNEIETIKVLEKLIGQYSDKQICIIWDNAKWHRGKKLRSLLGPGNKFANILLINLPTYAPECNPIEHVWNYGKEKVKNKSKQVFTNIKQAFLNAITNRVFEYQF